MRINTFKYHVFAPTEPVDNVVMATKGLQDRNTNITAGTTVENKGKLILTRCENVPQTTVESSDTPLILTPPFNWLKLINRSKYLLTGHVILLE